MRLEQTTKCNWNRADRVWWDDTNLGDDSGDRCRRREIIQWIQDLEIGLILCQQRIAGLDKGKGGEVIRGGRCIHDTISHAATRAAYDDMHLPSSFLVNESS